MNTEFKPLYLPNHHLKNLQPIDHNRHKNLNDICAQMAGILSKLQNIFPTGMGEMTLPSLKAL
jgi:hypothetical protein